MPEEIYKVYRHAPAHLFRPGAAYIVTAGTYGKRPYMAEGHRKEFWWKTLLRVMKREGWRLVAWVLLANHYHLLLHAPETGADRFSILIGDLHKFTARQWNAEDGTSGRRVWWNYWNTCITNERSYYARFNYIHWNPVKHGIVASPEEYPFSSYRFYLAEYAQELRGWEEAYPFDRLQVYDPF